MEDTEDEFSYLWGRRQRIVFKAQMNRLYQQDRQSVMEWREGVVKVASLIAGSVAFARVSDPTVVQWAAAVVFFGTAASMVFGWGAKARDAARRASQWVALLREIEAAGERAFTEAQVDAWTAQCYEIEASEPPANQKMVERAYCAAKKQHQDAPEDMKPPRGPAIIIP